MWLFIKQSIKKYYLLAIIFLIPWQARWLPGNFIHTDIYNEYTLPSIFIIDFLMLIGVLWYWKDFKKFNLHILFLVLVWLTVNAIFATRPFFVIWRALFLVIVFGFVYALKKNVAPAKIKVTLILAGVIQAIVGLSQFFYQHIPASTLLGIAEQSADILGSSVIETYNGRWLRAYGAFPHPNILGGFLVLAVFLVIEKYQNTYQQFITWWQENNKEFFTEDDKKYLKISGIKNVVLLIFFLIIFSGLLISFSRSAWLALTIGFIVYAILEYRKKNNIIPLLKLFAAGFLMMSSFYILYPDLFSTRFTNETRLEKNSVEERISGYESYTNIIANNWLTGTGLGNYVFELVKQNHGQPAYTYQPIHNTFILIIAEIGILGVILLGYIVHRQTFIWTSLSISLLVAISVLGLFDHYLWSLHIGVIILIMWLTNIED